MSADSEAAVDLSRAHLRLVWSNPAPPPPRVPIDLAQAIECHLAGRDGLSDEEFLATYARRAPRRPGWARAATS